MIGSVTGTYATAYTTRTNAPSSAPSEPMQQAAIGSEDDVAVELSPGGKLLSSLPTVFLDPKYHMANAEKRLNELMQQMGIPANTDISFKVSSGGHISVEGDSDKLGDLETMLNDGSEGDLRDSLVGAHTASTIQRIAAASQKTQAEVAANPQATEALWNQMLARADAIKNQSAEFSWSGGSLTGVFSDGTPLGVA